MKYAFITLDVTYGEYSALTHHVRAYNESTTLDEVSRNCAMGFCPCPAEEVEEVSKDRFNFFDGGTIVEISSAREITEAEFNVLNKYI